MVGLVLLAAAVMLCGRIRHHHAVQDRRSTASTGCIPFGQLGVGRALGVARLFHFLAVVGFFVPYWLEAFPVGRLYLAGVVVMALLLHFAHASLRRRPAEELDFRRIDRAFFHTNVGVSTSFFVLTLLDRIFLL